MLMSRAAWNLKKLMAKLTEQAARLFSHFFTGSFYLII